jgi:D-lactate dehydrogenase (cytochrome)
MITTLTRTAISPRQLITDPAELITYEVDAGFDRGKPDAVFYPESAADVSELVRWARANGLPIVARGAGTGLSGGAVPERGGVIVEFARMKQIVELNPTGRNGVVQSGVVNLRLDAAAKELGLYYPPDPSSGRSSLLGGNIGENAGGPHCFKYGVTTNYITGVEAVLADGRILRTGGQAYDYPELDLTAPIVGSEGTLALVTAATIRLIRNPPAVKTMMVSFRSDEAAGAAVSAIIAAGLMPATLEMMDQKVMGMIEAYVQVGLPVTAQAALIVEVDGYAASLDSQVAEIAGILTAHGGYDLRIAQSEAERQGIWYGRKSAAGAFSRLAPAFYLVDVTVPRSFLAETLREIGQVLARYDLETGHVFHAGDGNLHPCILCDPKDAAQMEHVFAATHEIVAICIAKDGSITGEHGVGIEKRAHMPAMYSAAELSAMRDVKLAFDPDNRLNPGKVLPDNLAPARAAPILITGDVMAPYSAEEAAAILAGCTAAQRRVRIVSSVVRVGDSRRDSALLLSTHELRGVQTFAPEDLYITAGAGTPLAELTDFLAGHGFQAPFAAPWPEATIGGLLATNLNAPLRMRYGGWRDNMLAVQAALPDGRVIRAGRPVVKNVAGYDLARLFVGSRGALGMMTAVTLKLTPLPRLRQTLRVAVDDVLQGIRWAQATAACWLMAAGVVVHRDATGQHWLTITLEGLPDDVRAEADAITVALRQAGAYAVEEAHDHTATTRWCDHLAAANGDDLLLRAGAPPQHLTLYWQMLPEEVRTAGAWFVDVAAGLLFVRLQAGDAATARRQVAQVREPALALRGYTVVQSGAGDIDPWGYRAEGADIADAIQRRWDPMSILVS